MSAQDETTTAAVGDSSRPVPSRAPSTAPSRATSRAHSKEKEKRPTPVNIAGPRPSVVHRQDSVRTVDSVVTVPSAERDGREEERPIWGVGGIFPKRGKRGGAKTRSYKRSGPSVAPSYSPTTERDDPFATHQVSPKDDVRTAAPSQHPSIRSRSSTRHDRDDSAGQQQERDSKGSPKEREDGDDHAAEDQQVGGQLMEDGEQWEDRMDEEEEERPKNFLATARYTLREPLAEFLGMLVLVTLGIGADCQVKISQNQAGSYSNMNVVWGMATMIGIYISGGRSGGHLNPTITIALAIMRGFPWVMVPKFIIAQVLGAFCGALIIYGNYKTALEMYDPDRLIYSTTGQNCSGPLFVTLPNQDAGGTTQGFFQELLATAILAIVVLALGDENNAPPGAGLGAFILGLTVMVIGMAMGWISGYAINSARDFGARLALWVLGFGKILWTHDSCWWIVGPICGCLAGALIGCLAYDVCIFVGPGSPVNSSTDELKHALGVAKARELLRSAFNKEDKSTRAQALREARAEDGLSYHRDARKRQDDSPGAEDAWRRWTSARRKMRKAEEEQRQRRKRRIEEIVKDKEKAAEEERPKP